MALNNLFRKIEAIERFDVVSESIDIINQNGWYISALLRLQLQQGKDGNDEPVTIFGRDFYMDATIFDKQRHGIGLGKQTEFITNYNSGAFYMSLVTVAEGTVFRTTSNVPYFDEILRRSGDIIMKLNKRHLIQFSKEILVPELRKRFLASSI